jgi:hypothetical protein
VVLVFFALGGIRSPVPAAAAPGHLFDAQLSLAGDCSTSVRDEVPDPGLCPMPPGVPGIDHPVLPFDQPCGTAVDSHGDVYVASAAQGGAGTGGRIDVFGPDGKYLTRIADEFQPCRIAVDSEGNVYVAEYTEKRVAVFHPKAYPPTAGSEKYDARKVLYDPFAEGGNPGADLCLNAWSVAVDPSNDHLYIGQTCHVREYDSYASGSASIKEGIGAGTGSSEFRSVSVYGANHDVYVSASGPGDEAQVLILDGGDGHKKCEVTGFGGEDFSFSSGFASIAVDQANGDVYVDDINEGGGEVVDQFDAGCQEIGQIRHSFKKIPINIGGAGLAVDNPCRKGVELNEPCKPGESYASPNEGYVYVAQGKSSSTYHLYAFRPRTTGPPEIAGQRADEITETEAILHADLNPNGLSTTYRFEYTTEADFVVNGFANAIEVPFPDASAGDGGAFAAVSEPIVGLVPGTAYRFRLVADNCAAEEAAEGDCLTQGEGKPGEEGASAAFATYAPEASLPDARGYELVTPSDTNGRIPTMAELGSGFNTSNFNTFLISPDGEGLVFGTEGGSIPALGGGGFHDTYEATRDGLAGWQSRFTGLSGTQAQVADPGGIASDHRYSFWQTEGAVGSLALNGSTGANYVRRPGGVLDPKCSPEPGGLFEFVGCGNLGSEPFARGKLISPDGGHVIFVAGKAGVGVEGKQLETCAPPTGTQAVYDRTPDGVTHCVSLLPGGATPSAASQYEGASADGSAVAFTVQGDPALYVRLDHERTVQATSVPAHFAGLAGDGSRLVYLRANSSDPVRPATEIPQGEIFACDVRTGPCAGADKTQDPVQIGSGEESVLVNVSPDGSHVYFVSPQQLDGSAGIAGEDNLYVWSAGSQTIRFIATLTAQDVEGRPSNGGIVGGLGLWLTHVVKPDPGAAVGAASDPSRTTPDGSVLVFESRAELNAYPSGGHAEVYHYDLNAEAGKRLTCVSCNPTGVAAISDALLQSDFGAAFATFPPVSSMTPVSNLTADGRKVFFQTSDSLGIHDTDGKIDVYEWESQGTGGCPRQEGCVHLISSGRSAGNDYLYAASPSGRDVFFETGDLLTPFDLDSTPSIYDARENGGFPAPPSRPSGCTDGTCQGGTNPPESITPASSNFAGTGNVGRKVRRHCRKGSAKARSRTKARCGKKHKSRRGHRHKAKTGKGGTR